MHGLINKSVQAYLRDHYGQRVWERVAHRIDIGPEGFEAMLHYEDDLTDALMAAAVAELEIPRAALLEDIGAFLAMREPLRRLLRFGGADYWEFLYSLDDLQGRSLMALPDLELPELTLRSERGGRFLLDVRGPMRGWGAVLAGLLRAMADDYGALALIEALENQGETERVHVALLEAEWAEGRRFDLARPGIGVLA